MRGAKCLLGENGPEIHNFQFPLDISSCCFIEMLARLGSGDFTKRVQHQTSERSHDSHSGV